MVKTLWSMLKDGLKAFLFWAVASGVLIYLFKYPGLIFSELLGLIFLAAFVACFRAPSSTRRTTATGVRREKAALSSGCKAHPATAPAGSDRSSHGGDEMSEAFG
jgi:hypothetical protein